MRTSKKQQTNKENTNKDKTKSRAMFLKRQDLIRRIKVGNLGCIPTMLTVIALLQAKTFLYLSAFIYTFQKKKNNKTQALRASSTNRYNVYPNIKTFKLVGWLGWVWLVG